MLTLAGCSTDTGRDRLPGFDPSGGSAESEGTGTSPGTDDTDDTASTGTTAPHDLGDGTTTSSDGPSPQVATVARPAGLVDDGSGTWTYEDNAVFYEIGQAFYAEHPDEYDFLAVYTEGEIPYYWAQALTVKFDIGGIGYDGVPPWVSPQDVGSAGALQQINVMNTPELYTDPSDASVLVHETAHRWSAFLVLDGLPTPGYLATFGHWSIHVETGGPSATGYGQLLDVGGGRFQYETVWPLRLSTLELYLAGLIAPTEVGPMFYVTSPTDYDPPTSPFGDEPWSETSYGEEVSFRGDRVDFTVEDLVAANGTRTPAAPMAQTHFRFAFILVCDDPNACDPDKLATVEAQRLAFPEAFEAATGDRATVDVDL